MAKDPMVPINLRVPQSMLYEIDARAALLGRDRSDVIRSAISRLLESGPRSVEERLAGLERRMSAVENPKPSDGAALEPKQSAGQP